MSDQNEASGTEDTGARKKAHRQKRVRVNFKVYIRLSAGDVTHAQALDLSQGGIYMEYGAAAEPGKIFHIAFDLPFENEFRRVFVKARVTRSVYIGARGSYGLAFAFTEFAHNTEKDLQAFISKRSASN